MAPSITTPPANVSVTAGQPASFSVTAVGTAPLQYQWLRNGAEIAGATAASYTIAATALADNGAEFGVRVSNTVSSVTSATATLTVAAAAVAPTITAQPQSVTVTAGQTATFSVTAGGTAPLSYQWQRGGVDIAGATASSYTTAATTVADNGAAFSVRVTNAGGSRMSTAATLTVTAGTGWVGGRQGDTLEGEVANAVAMDIDGGIVVVGTGPVVGSGSDAPDARVIKFDASGAVVWSRRIQSAGAIPDDNGYAVAVDGSGNIYVGGSTRGSLAGQSNAGGEDAFIARLDRAGQVAWIRQFGTTFGDAVRSLAIDPSGNVVAVGASVVAPSGNHFVAKYAPDGSRLWLREFTENSPLASFANAVAVDGTGAIYITGTTPQVGSNGLLVARLDAAGNRVWRAAFPDWRGATRGYSIAVSSDGARIYVSGETDGHVEGGTPTGSSTEGFLLQLSAGGTPAWARQIAPNAFPIGATQQLSLRGVATSASGAEVTVTGWVAGARSGTGATADDLIVARYDAAGARTWARQIASLPNNMIPLAGDDRGLAIAVDGVGDAFVAGLTMGHLGTPPTTTWGSQDWFVLKLRGVDGSRY
jgi:hypothetical protein